MKDQAQLIGFRQLTALAPPSRNDIAWPPRTPYHALLSSPSGERKLERRRECPSPSPSPIKQSSLRTNPNRSPQRQQSLDEDGEEEDEETLQLELQAIEARLKLKRLQQAKARQQEAGGVLREGQDRRSPTRQHDRTPIPHSRGQNDVIEVPLSPSDKNRSNQTQRSPARIILGIDKGLKARDVSLKRAYSTNSQRSRLNSDDSRHKEPQCPPKKSFSERIAESRSSDRERQEKQDRLKKSRSQGFDIQSAQHDDHTSSVDTYSSRRNDQHSSYERSKPTAGTGIAPFGRGSSRPTSGGLRRSKSVSNSIRDKNSADAQEQQGKIRELPKGNLGNGDSSNDLVDNPFVEDASVFEPYSGLHLSKRLITHNVLTRALEGKETFTIPRLFKTVRSPVYDPPDVEGDYVVFAVIASKSTPYNHRNVQKIASSGGHNDEEARPKFMVLKLTDFKWEIDLYLFGTGFERFWKLTVGTVVAILNPGIMPPKNRDTGAFSLKVSSSEDTVLEIGKSRDLGFCKSVKKDGKECGAWIDKRSTEFCEFHVSMLLDKTKAGRMEVNGMAGFGKRKGDDRSSFRGRSRVGGNAGNGRGREARRQGEWHDRYLHETMYITPSLHGASAARLLDAEDANDARDKADIQRKRKADIDKETELAKRLASTGSGTGKEYLQVRHTDLAKENFAAGQTRLSTETVEPPDAATLGLLGNKALEIKLSPVKRGRPLARESSAPMGWGGASRRGMLDIQPRQAPPDREKSPSKKKARFMLDQGIRQPGRESLGNPAQPVGRDDDDDDELEIV